MKNKINVVIASVLVSAAILLILYALGPAEVFKVNLETDSQVSAPGDEVRVIAEIEMQAEENIPVKAIAVDVDGVRCMFPVNGGKSLTMNSICQNVRLRRLPGRTGR